ncbi:MAG: DRTGG domain-containing protein [Spirochaetales bacterium]|nr:DRTGG domain-containing protein [Spirochaetales bacterium]
MKISDLEKQLGYSSLWEGYGDGEIADGYTSDLLSDVMGNAPDESVLITIQAHKNTVAVASLAGINAIVLCNNRPAPEEMIEAAKEEGVAVFRSSDSQFTTSWKIHDILAG